MRGKIFRMGCKHKGSRDSRRGRGLENHIGDIEHKLNDIDDRNFKTDEMFKYKVTTIPHQERAETRRDKMGEYMPQGKATTKK